MQLVGMAAQNLVDLELLGPSIPDFLEVVCLLFSHLFPFLEFLKGWRCTLIFRVVASLPREVVLEGTLDGVRCG